MKKFIYAASFLFIALAMGVSSAQAKGTTVVSATVPFDFVVGEKTLAAGEYQIRIRRTSETPLIELRDSEGNWVQTTFAFSNGDAAGEKSELVFDKVGGRTVLAKIRIENIGYSLFVANEATQIAAKASKGSKAEAVRN